ncbi:secretin N-terminal domain-containing protein [Paraburkholderia sp. SARCC-3016]|uniref:secretin N-terminal domain-containing protein n=1 Tax=Paraburkholderia sp. SARCC-3016 TaxID=3058611 RepID=UPI00280A282F|nr:secretin N-terminal domain-containing protein [Paraburkholderia sp. SARCC-3016]MDQ7980277.1 secretin N-terminal domain-containing protein [Paraburkholderia sp. SARCC-3016]
MREYPISRLSRARTIVSVTSALVAAFLAPPAHAARVDWPGSRFAYATNGSNVPDVLREFAADEHIALRIDGPVEGVVSGRFSMPPQRFLDALASAFGFVWYDDGAVLQVSPANAQLAVALRPQALSTRGLAAALEQAGVIDARFPLDVDGAEGTVDISGPKSYIARIRAAAERFERDAGSSSRTTVRVFRLSYANAADETSVIDGRTVVVPGAATLLRRRFRRSAKDATEPASAAGAGSAPTRQIVELGTPLPAIEADAATNSILVRDKPERIDADGMLVKNLDTRPQLISVQTWIVDVDVDALGDLQSMLPPALASIADAGARFGSGIAPGEGQALMAQIEALAKARRAHIEVSRTALTRDRTPAIFDRYEARLARRVGYDLPEDPALDLWLSVRPTVEGAAMMQRIGLEVELGRRAADEADHRKLAQSVEPGGCFVIAAPTAGNASGLPARERLVLLIPRIAA